jgi:hypothetical protein
MPFQPSLMYLGKSEAYPSEATFGRSILGDDRGFSHKYQTQLETLAMGKQS